MVDRVRPLKIEDTTHGTESDMFPTETDPHEDFLDAHGVSIQNTTSDDSAALIARDASDNMTFTDPVVGTKTLYALSNGGFDPNSQLLEMSGAVVYIGDGNIVVK